MIAFLHLLATLVLVPYVLLASAFALFSRAIARGTPLGFLDAILTYALWLIPWGALAFIAGTVALAVCGMIERTRRAAGAVLCVLAVASAVAIPTLASSPPDADTVLFLGPCVAVAIFGAWRASHAA